MANLILASKREVKSGSQMWHVYRLSENNKSEEFYFSQVGKAVRYMFLLRKRGGGLIPKAVYNKIMAEYKANKPQGEQYTEPQPTAQAVGEAETAEEKQRRLIINGIERMKAKHPDMICFFEANGNYEVFGEDAKAVSEICGCSLTTRAGLDYVTWPKKELDWLLPKCVRAGKRVGMCESVFSLEDLSK